MNHRRLGKETYSHFIIEKGAIAVVELEKCFEILVKGFVVFLLEKILFETIAVRCLDNKWCLVCFY